MIRYFFAIISIVLISCNSTGLKVKGTISDAPNLSVYFDKVDPIEGSNNIVLRSETDGSGNFTLSSEKVIPQGIYRVRIGAQSAYLILDGSEKEIIINGSLNELPNFNFSVSGSPTSQALVNTISSFARGEKSVQDLTSYVEKEADPIVAMMIATQFFGGTDEFYALHKTVAQRLASSYPSFELTPTYSNFALTIEQAYQQRMSLEKVKVGEIAPDISLPDVNGKPRKLSELRGKVVLLDFWAAWCGPCRKENPNVVRVYDKYASSGFTVFSVSLDGIDDATSQRYPSDQLDNMMRSQKERWVAAIQQDNLKWDTHVSDLKKWSSAGAAIYGVRSIPRTFLIDREGKIAAINPRGNLEEAVKSLM